MCAAAGGGDGVGAAAAAEALPTSANGPLLPASPATPPLCSPASPPSPLSRVSFSQQLQAALAAVEARDGRNRLPPDAQGRAGLILQSLDVVHEATGARAADRTLLFFATGFMKEESEEAALNIRGAVDLERVTVVRVAWDSGSMGEIFRAMEAALEAQKERRAAAAAAAATEAAAAPPPPPSPLAAGGRLGAMVAAGVAAVRSASTRGWGAVSPYAKAAVAGVKQLSAEANFEAKERQARVAGELLAAVLAEMSGARLLAAYPSVVLMGHSLGGTLVVHALAALGRLRGGGGGGGGAPPLVTHGVLMGAAMAGPEQAEVAAAVAAAEGPAAAARRADLGVWLAAAIACGTLWNVYHKRDLALRSFSAVRKLKMGAVGSRALEFAPPGGTPVVNIDVTELLPRKPANLLSHAYSPFVAKILLEAKPALAVVPLRAGRAPPSPPLPPTPPPTPAATPQRARGGGGGGGGGGDGDTK